MLDHIFSIQPRLISQMSGFLTFVYHISVYVHVHVMRKLFLSETLLAKEALEKIIAKTGKTVKHYHADNGIFSENGFIDAINQKDKM